MAAKKKAAKKKVAKKKVAKKAAGKKPKTYTAAKKKQILDFIKKFKFARIWGDSAKFPGQKQSLKHVLVDKDVVELHMA